MIVFSWNNIFINFIPWFYITWEVFARKSFDILECSSFFTLSNVIQIDPFCYLKSWFFFYFRWNVLLPMTITDGSISVKRRTEWPLMLYNMPAPYDRLINCCHFCALKETVPRAWAAPTKTQWWVLKFHEFFLEICYFLCSFAIFTTFWLFWHLLAPFKWWIWV